MTRWTWGYLYWGIGWILLGFLAAEVAGITGAAPWPTLSETVWHANRYPGVPECVFGVLVGLSAHFLFRRPLVHALVFGLGVALLAHFADKSWP